MRNQWKKVTLITSLILSLSSIPSFAQQSGYKYQNPGSGMKRNSGCEMMMKELNLTPDQKQKIDTIMKDTKTQAEPLIKCMWDKKKALMQYIFSPQATKEQALIKAKDITDTKYQIESIFIDGMFKAKCVLTPEQQQKFVDLHQKRMMEFKGIDPDSNPTPYKMMPSTPYKEIPPAPLNK